VDLDAENYDRIKKIAEKRGTSSTNLFPKQQPLTRMETSDFTNENKENTNTVFMPRNIKKKLLADEKPQLKISEQYIKNVTAREYSNFCKESEELHERKHKIAIWADIISSMKYIVKESGSYCVQLFDEDDIEPLNLKEIVYDGILFSTIENAFIYIEVELRYTPLIPTSTRKGSTFSGKAETGGKNSNERLIEFSSIPKTKACDYTFIITTVNLTRLSRRTEESQLSSFLVVESHVNEATESKDLLYSQIKQYAMTYAKRVINKVFVPIKGGGTSTDRGSFTNMVQYEETKELLNKTSGLPTDLAMSRSLTSTFIIGTMQQSLHAMNIGKTKFYEEMIRSIPPIICRVIIGHNSKQILFRLIDPIHNINNDIPISFYQVTQDCNLPISMLQNDVLWSGKRLLDTYKGMLIKQFCSGFQENEIYNAPPRQASSIINLVKITETSPKSSARSKKETLNLNTNRSFKNHNS